MDSLREKQFKAFKKRVELTDGTMYRVYVGPKIDRRRAIAAKAEIDQLFNTDSLLLKYVP
jgi:DedD protein